ncbi:exported hypothetical protein [Candidatus Methanoperedens nitroreducens]|uniref:Uncharacterized protein n=2 Tax=Candidatus Methanoperedens nitratireducens TaxID=1392998 RepID=A0A284VPS2_9EURY|nr:exported hypothetical protein [Candidatus Methanoperedens nitroreducens]
MRNSSTALIVLVLVSIMAVTGPAFSILPVKKIAEDTPKIGQIEDNITKPLNRGEEHVNTSISMVGKRISPPENTIGFIIP